MREAEEKKWTQWPPLINLITSVLEAEAEAEAVEAALF